jgi:predicted GNAT family N-acyltransferase
MLQNLIIEIAEFGSKKQIQSIGLRYEVLRRPLGLFFGPADLFLEKSETHIIAILNTEVIGIMLLKDIGNEAIKMRQVAVSGHFQGKGIGAKMVRYAEVWARSLNFKTMELHAREKAINFYLKLNYKKVGAEFLEVGIPHWKMEKSLS